jgi:hypothetical protein
MGFSSAHAMDENIITIHATHRKPNVRRFIVHLLLFWLNHHILVLNPFAFQHFFSRSAKAIEYSTMI